MPRAMIAVSLLAAGWLAFRPPPRAAAQDTSPSPHAAAQDTIRPPHAAARDTIPPPPAVPPLPEPATSTPSRDRVTSTLRYVPEDRDRFEFGAGPVKGFFDILGSVAYRRWMGQGPVFEQNLMLELTGSAKDQLTEGAVGVYLFMRPSFTYRDSWKIRPLIEFGPAAHIVVQVASLEELSSTLYKSRVYVKTHGYAGFETSISSRVGFLFRGRVSIPSHRPFDYAQAAIFLR